MFVDWWLFNHDYNLIKQISYFMVLFNLKYLVNYKR